MRLINMFLAKGMVAEAMEESFTLESMSDLMRLDMTLGDMEAREPSVSDPTRYQEWLKHGA